MMRNLSIQLLEKVKFIIETLENENFEAYVVGGCVRDSLLQKEPKDWDITTNCLPNNLISIFKDRGISVIETGLQHGTVTLMIEKEGFEVTTFRTDGQYSDGRHPDAVEFTSSLREDLGRRDFTINAMAYTEKTGLIDYYDGLTDLQNKRITAVGDSSCRFEEDALRRLRAIRFATVLDFQLEENTAKALCVNNDKLNFISVERIREEFIKILLSTRPSYGLELLRKFDMVKFIVPELQETFDFNQQNKHHDKDIFAHTLAVLENTPPRIEVRLAALLHDIGKPSCFTMGEDLQGHFLDHHIVGADLSKKILKTLKFDTKTIEKVFLLVYEHMSRHENFTSRVAKRLINRVGQENLEDLFALQIADIQGSAKEYQDISSVLNMKKSCEKILAEKEPLSVKDLKITGSDLIGLGFAQGMGIGKILNELMELVLDCPELNNKDFLLQKAKEYRDIL